MIKRKYVLIATEIVVFILIFAVVSTSLDSIAQNSVKQSNFLLPNRDFLDIQHYNDSLSDSNGNRTYPWGIEIWAGSPSSYFTVGQVQLTGHNNSDAEVLAIPDPPGKPIVTPGISYTETFDVKLDNVQGRHGVRLVYQSFNSTLNTALTANIIQKVYGKWENGTSGWHTISLTVTPVNGAVVGDVICELWGSGTVYIKNAEFHTTTVIDTLSQINLSRIVVTYTIVAVILIILVAGGLSVISLVTAPIKKLKQERGIKK